jgi:hypothetical protein
VKNYFKELIPMARSLTTAELQVAVDRLLVTSDLCHMFNRTEMSICNYRNRERDPLPVVLCDDRVVGYVKSDVIKWARRNNIHIHEGALK